MGSGFQSFGGGLGGVTSIGGKYTGLGSFAVYDKNIGSFIQNYFYSAKAAAGGGSSLKLLDQAGPNPTKPTISAKENAEIDAAIISGKAIPAIILRNKDLFDKQVHAVLNPIIPDVILTGGPPPILQPTVAVKPPSIPTQSVGAPSLPSTVSVSGPTWDTGPASTSYPTQPTPGQPGQVCIPMNLSGILGGIGSIADTIGGLASTYYNVRNARAGVPQPMAAPPAVNPALPIQFAGGPGTLASTPAAALARTAAMVIPSGVTAMAGLVPTGLGGLLGKAFGIAAAYGLSVEVVSAILREGTPKRRRKRLLTKSDVADISTMAALLGKNSEAFKTWLAVSRR